MTQPSSEDGPFRAAINRKLASIAAASSPTPPWYEAWQRLSPESTEVEQLAACQAIRDNGCLPLEAGFYLVAWQADVVAAGRAETELHELDEQMAEFRRAHGFGDDGFWAPGKSPPGYRELCGRHEAAWNQLFVDTLVACGENEMADLFQDDHDEFERLFEDGRLFFHGASPADLEEADVWLGPLVDQIAGLMTLDGPAGPLGCRCAVEGGFWEIVVYLTPGKLVGGADDGELVAPGFQLNLIGLQDLFDEIIEFGWDGLGTCNPDGPLVWIDGVYQGRELYFAVLARAPEGEEPGFQLDMRRRSRG